ncbi:MAG: hypothetical protein OES23_06905 [Nitrosopumilus sp.]|nr:hypothetical protein [Nitrosopumilus sp.]
MSTFLAVDGNDLARLSAEKAVELFRQMLWAEATSIGLGKNIVNVPQAITVADGGIDAEVNAEIQEGGQGIIKKGLNRYQIKTGNFSVRNKTDVKNLLFNSGTNEIKTRIKSSHQGNNCQAKRGFYQDTN